MTIFFHSLSDGPGFTIKRYKSTCVLSRKNLAPITMCLPHVVTAPL